MFIRPLMGRTIIVLTVLLYVVLGVFLTDSAHAKGVCDTEFTNPFSHVAWGCTFPIRMAGMNISPSGPDPESKVSSVLCSCDDGAYQRVGISVGFRQPRRLLDVVKTPFCLASLGMDLGSGTMWEGGAAISSPGVLAGNVRSYSGITHYYFFNPMLILEIMLDMPCSEKLPLDVAAMSELDPFAHSDELALLAFPETIFFANPVAVLACAADAVSATSGLPIDALFWCAGSWGATYPLTNMAPGYEGNWTTAAALVATKYLARGHRELLNWGTKGDAAMCGPYPQPIIQKTQYRLQPNQPINSQSCLPIGRSGLLWDTGKNPPVPGAEGNFSFIVWNYVDCCLR